MEESSAFHRTFARRWRRCSSIVAGTLALAGCRLTTSGVSPITDVPERARLLRIEDTRRDEPAFLDSMLVAPSPALRATAAMTAGRLGSATHRAAVRPLVGDVDAAVAGNALFALALLHDTASIPLATAALHRDPAVATRAAWLLGEIGEPARASLIAALADASVQAETRGALLLAANRLRPVPAAAVIPWVSSRDSAIAWRAAYALARGRSAAGVRTLLAAASSPWATVREQAARGLGRTLAGDSLGDAALTALRALSADADAHVRVNAVRALGTYAARGRPDVVRAMRDGDPAVRLTAAQTLDQVLDSAATSWNDALAADTALVVQRVVAEGMAKRGLTGAVVADWHRSGDWQRRVATVEVETIGPAAVALPRAEGWSHDGDARVRAAAAGVIARLADSTATRARARHALTVQLNDEDFSVRTAALNGLASGATGDDLYRAIVSYARGTGDRDFDARLAFWQLADSALRSRAAMPDSVTLALAAIPRPADPLERRAASAIPRFAGWLDDTSPARPLAWYEARVREMVGSRLVAQVETDRGTMRLDLFGSDAPLTVYNFVSLARQGYFDGQRFHRVVPNFVAQGGDPRGDGSGGPGYAIRDEINPHRYVRGTLGMALAGPNTGGSQFFITHSPQPHLDGGYTVFGQLASGGDVLDRIVQGDRIVRITIQ